jgi:hypothetical protein
MSIIVTVVTFIRYAQVKRWDSGIILKSLVARKPKGLSGISEVG